MREEMIIAALPEIREEVERMVREIERACDNDITQGRITERGAMNALVRIQAMRSVVTRLEKRMKKPRSNERN